MCEYVLCACVHGMCFYTTAGHAYISVVNPSLVSLMITYSIQKRCFLQEFITVRVCNSHMVSIPAILSCPDGGYGEFHTLHLGGWDLTWENSTFTILSLLWFQSADGRPTLLELQHFPTKEGFEDIVAEIQNDYVPFGIRLLEDSNGVKIKGIAMSKFGNTVDITVEVLSQWLLGKGRRPVIWRTFVECLRESGLNVPADYIEAELGGSKYSQQQQQPASDSSKCPLPDFIYSFSNCGAFVSF